MKHFLDIFDHSPEELQDILDLAVQLKKEYFSGGNAPLFKGKVLGMIFQKPSLRTRFRLIWRCAIWAVTHYIFRRMKLAWGSGNPLRTYRACFQGMYMQSWRVFSSMNIFWNWQNGHLCRLSTA